MWKRRRRQHRLDCLSSCCWAITAPFWPVVAWVKVVCLIKGFHKMPVQINVKGFLDISFSSWKRLLLVQRVPLKVYFRVAATHDGFVVCLFQLIVYVRWEKLSKYKTTPSRHEWQTNGKTMANNNWKKNKQNGNSKIDSVRPIQHRILYTMLENAEIILSNDVNRIVWFFRK